MKNRYILYGELQQILDTCEAEGRTQLNRDESRAYAVLEEQLDALDPQGQRPTFSDGNDGSRVRRDPRLLPGGLLPGGTRQAREQAGKVTLTRSEQLADTVPPHERGTQELSLGRFVRGLATGMWDGADAERAMSIGSSAAGGVLVPQILSLQVIDLARNNARVIQAGAVTVPMTESTLRMARVTGDPTMSWHSENAAIVASDPAFDSVTFTAQSLTALVKISRELWEDAVGLDQVLLNALSAGFALELDRVALLGSGTAPEPRGLRNTAGLTLVSMGTNGLALSNYDPFVDAITAVENGNFSPTAAIYAPRTAGQVAKMKSTIGDPLEMPASVAALQHLVTKQVRTDMTQGTSSLASDVYIGDWAQCLIGMRTTLQIQVLTERYSDNGQYALQAWMRADVQFTRVAAFAAVVGIL